MSVITEPDNLRISAFLWKLQRNQIMSRSVFGSQAIEGSPPQWAVSMTGVPQFQQDVIIHEVFLEALDGLRNQVALYHRMQPYPAGTMRGTMLVDVDAADGATSLVIDAGVGQAGTTLLKGDFLGMGTGVTQQVVRLSANATADVAGVITVTLTTALRNAFAAGASVTWDRPKALFRQRQDNKGIEYGAARIGQAWALDLIEDWRA